MWIVGAGSRRSSGYLVTANKPSGWQRPRRPRLQERSSWWVVPTEWLKKISSHKNFFFALKSTRNRKSAFFRPLEKNVLVTYSYQFYFVLWKVLDAGKTFVLRGETIQVHKKYLDSGVPRKFQNNASYENATCSIEKMTTFWGIKIWRVPSSHLSPCRWFKG